MNENFDKALFNQLSDKNIKLSEIITRKGGHSIVKNLDCNYKVLLKSMQKRSKDKSLASRNAKKIWSLYEQECKAV